MDEETDEWVQWGGLRELLPYIQRTDKSLLINIFIHIHSSWLANARVIDSLSDSNTISNTLARGIGLAS